MQSVTKNVVKRSGKVQPFAVGKIATRMEALRGSLAVDVNAVATKVMRAAVDGITTQEIDEWCVKTLTLLTVEGGADYGTLAARIMLSDIYKRTPPSFSAAMLALAESINPDTKLVESMLSPEFIGLVKNHAAELDAMIVPDRDATYSQFGLATLAKAYLLKLGNGTLIERPQYIHLRVALWLHGDDMAAVRESYDLMSLGFFAHATPTQFNAGSTVAQGSSCFLLAMKADSLTGITSTLTDCAFISKNTGGIGLSVHKVRAAGSAIALGGTSNGLVAMLKVFESMSRYVDQGGGKRKGSFAIYLEPWHADIEAFIDLRKNVGEPHVRAHSLFIALWVPDLFFVRLRDGGGWTLFCPRSAPGLADVHGAAFDELYTRYEREGRGRRTMTHAELVTLWRQILHSQMESGLPYLLAKDACNAKSNQQNLGTIQSSNLCAEIIEYSSPTETAVCNLASINLSRFVTADGYDFQNLARVVGVAVRNLNRVIDIGYSPVKEAAHSNAAHRPIGVGVQALADVFHLLELSFDEPRARELNRDIFETIYFGAMRASIELAERDGAYSSFANSPLSQGKFQFDLWNEKPNPKLGWDWEDLRVRVMRSGARNSLLVALMPTASTAQIMGNNECFEPYTSNLYSRSVLAGVFIMLNPHLTRALAKIGFDEKRAMQILTRDNGSVQNLDIPDELKERFRTVWEIKQRGLIEMARDRAPFVDQSQSMNLFIDSPTVDVLTSMHMFTWSTGLKTIIYYLRSQPGARAEKNMRVDESCLACAA